MHLLKAWIDHIARAGVTIKYTETGAEGLVKDKVVYIAMASGGIYSSGPMQGYDFAYPGQADIAAQKGIDSIQV